MPLRDPLTSKKNVTLAVEPGEVFVELEDNTRGAYQRIPTDENLVDVDVSSSNSTTNVHPCRSCVIQTPSFWDFVVSPCFQLLTTMVIICNLATIILEMENPTWLGYFATFDQVVLCFYVFELLSRACNFGVKYLRGPFGRVGWNYLDMVVVCAGILDTWVMPYLPPEMASDNRFQATLTLLRLLRFFRALKIIRVFLDADLTWAESPMFQSFIGVVIGLNAALMGAETDYEWGGWLYIEQVLLIIYVFELCVRIKRIGFGFFSSMNEDIVWNVLDFVIVTTSVIDGWVVPFVVLVQKCLLTPFTGHEDDELDVLEKKEGQKGGFTIGQAMMLLRMCRLLRVLRLIKLVKSVRPLYVLVTGVTAAVQGVAWVLVLVFTAVYAMGIVATRLIGHGILFPPGSAPKTVEKPFARVADSMFTLFRAMSGASSVEEATAINDLMKDAPSAKFAFIFFMITSSWTLLSILTAVVSENMISTTSDQASELRIIAADEERKVHIAELKAHFSDVDADGDGTVDQAELATFLEIEENAVNTAKACRVPTSDVKDVLTTLCSYGRSPSLDEFVVNLVETSRPTTERSILKLQSVISMENRSLQDNLRDALAQIVELEVKNGKKIDKLQDSLNAALPRLEQLEQSCVDAPPRRASAPASGGSPATPVSLDVRDMTPVMGETRTPTAPGAPFVGPGSGGSSVDVAAVALSRVAELTSALSQQLYEDLRLLTASLEQDRNSSTATVRTGPLVMASLEPLEQWEINKRAASLGAGVATMSSSSGNIEHAADPIITAPANLERKEILQHQQVGENEHVNLTTVSFSEGGGDSPENNGRTSGAINGVLAAPAAPSVAPAVSTTASVKDAEGLGQRVPDPRSFP